jgi:hypothetical protein
MLRLAWRVHASNPGQPRQGGTLTVRNRHAAQRVEHLQFGADQPPRRGNLA